MKRRTTSRRPLPIVWTDRALRDLRDIGDFIARDNVVAELGREDIREVLRRTIPEGP